MVRTLNDLLILIPARGGSKGILNKNMVDLCGSPLLSWTANVAVKSKLSDTLILSTDSEDIAKYGSSLGLATPFIRPRGLARDDTLQIDVMKHALSFMSESFGMDFTSLLLLQPTSPFRKIETLHLAYHQFKKLKADTLISVSEISRINDSSVYEDYNLVEKDFFEFYKIKSHGNTLRGTLRQNYIEKWYRNEAIYIFDVSVLLKTDSLYGGKTIGMSIDPIQSIQIDSLQDLEIAELVALGIKQISPDY